MTHEASTSNGRLPAPLHCLTLLNVHTVNSAAEPQRWHASTGSLRDISPDGYFSDLTCGVVQFEHFPFATK